MSLDTIAAAGPVSRATEVQRIASDPALSAFVSANAGSGKTKVLVDRVLRLLLAGTPPGKILCLTYTKAAAAHMAVKVFDRLASWVTQTDAELAHELGLLEGRRPSPARLIAARRLFAQAVETPGGLKIETIHAFCERLLHLVPFEANVPARFEVLDEAAQEELVADATRAVLSEAAAGGSAATALYRVSLEAAGDLFTTAIRAALAQRAFLRDIAASAGGVAAAMEALAQALGLLPGDALATIERTMLEGGLPPAEWAAVAGELAGGGRNDQQRAADLRAADAATEPAERLERYLAVFFTEEGKPRADTLVTKKVAQGLAIRMRDERDRLAGLVDRRRAARTVERTAALMTLAEAILSRVEALKHARGALDFDDLIDKTRTLLERSEAASWVLHKLDAGIDHVLVDEAQDTNPAQWDILRALTAEFTVGAGARQEDRTVFAVGDPKQSIYGFQGADPRAFAESGRYFARAAAAAGHRFEPLELNVSFRSAPAVLAAVDLVFGVSSHFAGLAFGEDATVRAGTVHATSRLGHYGRVEIWTPTAAEEDPEPDAWAAPVDTPEPTSAAVVLAERIARNVRVLVREGDETGRRVPAGEVLILVRKRGALFEAVIRALKGAGLPVAGADRLRLGEHIAVLDLVAAGRAALLADDDLTLATVLKSPLGGLDDDDLVAIAARRPGRVSLRAALSEAAAGNATAAAALGVVERLEAMSGRLGPFGFYAALLGPLGGRRALVARLGPEAHDAIDEFLGLALAHEQRETPSLALFLARFGDAAHDVKRDMDASRGEIRVMTVHGAKGLEAQTVILADACRYDERLPPLLTVDVGGGGLVPRQVPVWLPAAAERPTALEDACNAARSREREEHNRLLYVAMTRAKERLVIAPHLAKAPKVPPRECWYGMIDAALGGAADGGGGVEVRELADPRTGEALRVVASGAHAAPVELSVPATAARLAPTWLTAPAPRQTSTAPALLPSAAGGRRPARTGPSADDREARREGLLLHALLERLPAQPAAARPAAAERYLASQAADWPAARRQALATETLAIIAAPRLKALFGPAGRSEVEVAGEITLPDGGAFSVSGRIDRLALTDEAILIADFKSGQAPGVLADSHVTQLALYGALVRRALPGRRVRPLLVYRTGLAIVELTAEQQHEALQRLAPTTATAGG
ncbi:double-strand break repair helicase AddA [Chelatococcus reniformis]|uniref:DNA 3'-5' helicase n=1 Tax=Chelatococcus reniformis TaxID=1494448 RepID=A0A916TW44_9HYPH|nr:double-strand break repair helicase AddA [Chelatococcus reniformis]GGC45408.1 double-strand break repair helicase AddA [Chelatococcus reniformis]